MAMGRNMKYFVFWPLALLEVLLLTSLDKSECQEFVIAPGADTSVTIGVSPAAPSCTVCLLRGETDSDNNCSASLVVGPGSNAILHFNCSEPNEAVSVVIHKAVVCTVTACTTDLGVSLTSLFMNFSKTFVWDVTAPSGSTLRLDNVQGGLREVTAAEACTDGYRYTINSTQAPGNPVSNTYCKMGPISNLDLPNRATISLLILPGEALGPAMFRVASQPLVKRGRVLTFSPEPNTAFRLWKVAQNSSCNMCTSKGSRPGCHPQLSFKDVTNVEFSCTEPQNVFGLQIIREIGCTDVSCQGDMVTSGSSLYLEFNRTFIWDVKPPSSKGLEVDFLGSGMRQILPTESCPDGHTYTLVTYQRAGPVTIGMFCSSGPVRKVQTLLRARVSVQLPAQKALQSVPFDVTVGPDIKTLAEVFVAFPTGASVTTLFSANYPQGFPDDDLMTWSFTVPPRHNYSVAFVGYTEPRCVKKDVAVEYDWLTGSFSAGFALSDIQPSQKQGGFRMSLRNCEGDRSGTGLSLNFQVSVVRSNYPVLCSVDLQADEGLVIDIKKKNLTSPCEMMVNSKKQEEVTMGWGMRGNVSFQDCGSEELLITVTRSLDVSKCPQQEPCSLDGLPMSLSGLEACLPAPIHSISWHLQSPEQGMLQLLHPTGGFKQLLSGQECEGSFSLVIAEDNGVPVGAFCPSGPLQNIQVRSNASVTAAHFRSAGVHRSKAVFLNVSRSTEVTEGSIFSVLPEVGSPVLLASPGWPLGMSPGSTASWQVSLPPEYNAELRLINITWPRCAGGQSRVAVQVPGSAAELFSRSSDGLLVSPEERLTVAESFYVNMSSCEAAQGGFGVMGKVTLQKKSILLLISILGAVGALLLLLIAALIVFCVVNRKRKKTKRMSIYNPNGNVFLEGQARFTKSRDADESHIYDSIKEPAAYRRDHPEHVDMYRSFMGPEGGGAQMQSSAPEALEPDMDTFRPFLGPPQPGVPGRPRTPVLRQDSLAYADPRMVDNELYTFKSNGDTGPVFLPPAEPNPEPELEEQESEEEWD